MTGGATTTVTRTFEAIGTSWRLDAACAPERFDAEIMPLVAAEIEAYDQAFSRFRSDSLVSAMARQAGAYQLPAAAAELLGLYRRLYELTDGAVTPLVGQALSDAGYDADYSLVEKPMIPPPAWDDVLIWNGGTDLTLQQPALLDFGAAGKGQLIDLIADVARRAGITDITVDGSGDLIHHGGASLRVGLEDPNDSTAAVGVAELADGQALCGSAGNRRRWGRFHHILNPQTLAPVDDIAAVWTVAGSALVADGLATALFFVEPERLSADFDFEYVILRPDRTARISGKFPGALF